MFLKDERKGERGKLSSRWIIRNCQVNEECEHNEKLRTPKKPESSLGKAKPLKGENYLTKIL